jgi:FkbM family methyltransferase
MTLKTRNWWDEYISREVQDYVKYFKPLPTDIIVDCGAHIGSFSVGWAPFVQQVYAFEPHPENFATLVANIEENDLQNVIPYNMAVSDYDGEAMMNEVLPDNSGTNNIFCTGEGCMPVPVVRLDNIITGPVDFLKIDVEGAEVGVLNGATTILETYHPKIAMEVHGGENFRIVREILASYGYTIYSDWHWFGLWIVYAE